MSNLEFVILFSIPPLGALLIAAFVLWWTKDEDRRT